MAISAETLQSRDVLARLNRFVEGRRTVPGSTTWLRAHPEVYRALWAANTRPDKPVGTPTLLKFLVAEYREEGWKWGLSALSSSLKAYERDHRSEAH